MSDTMKAGLIGAGAVLLAALIIGIFVLASAKINSPPNQESSTGHPTLF